MLLVAVGRAFRPGGEPTKTENAQATVPEKNSKGTWYGWKIDMVSEVTDVAIYNQAKAFAQSINAQGFSEETSEETPPF